MPKVTFITLDGKEHEIEAEEGTTLMEIGLCLTRSNGS